jgi:hypothetical protein
MLMINIWMYELKATNCCAALRIILNSGPDGGACPPGAGPCRGFEGNCGDIIAQYADLPVLPDHPNGMADYVCTAFPDDARFVDTFLVSLLSIGAALPVTLVIFTCFDMANDGGAPSNVLAWPMAWPALVWGPNAHRKWHYVREGQPPFFVKWFIRFRLWGYVTIAQDLWTRFVCMLTCAEMPWHVEAREAAEAEEEEEREAQAKEKLLQLSDAESRGCPSPHVTAEMAIFAECDEKQDEKALPVSPEECLEVENQELRDGRVPPVSAEAAIFAECNPEEEAPSGDGEERAGRASPVLTAEEAIFASQEEEEPLSVVRPVVVDAPAPQPAVTAEAAIFADWSTVSEVESELAEEEEEEDELDTEIEEEVRFRRRITAVGFGAVYLSWAIMTWFIFGAFLVLCSFRRARSNPLTVYGMLVYKLLGQPAIDAFASSFGVSYGLNQVTEWQDIGKEALKAVFIMMVLERLAISSPVGWLEEHVDFLSVQAVLMQQNVGIIGRIRAHLRFSSRSA